MDTIPSTPTEQVRQIGRHVVRLVLIVTGLTFVLPAKAQSGGPQASERSARSVEHVVAQSLSTYPCTVQLVLHGRRAKCSAHFRANPRVEQRPRDLNGLLDLFSTFCARPSWLKNWMLFTSGSGASYSCSMRWRKTSS